MSGSARHRRRSRRRWQWVGWRFRRCEPDKVWVDDKDYIGLLQLNVRGLQAQADNARLRAEANGYEAQNRARALLGDHPVAADLLADLPVSADGQLHEQALLALIGQDELNQRRRQRQRAAS